MGEASQTTAKQHPVKAGHHTLDILLEFGDKLLHGVSPWFSVADLIHPTTSSEERQTPFAACRYAGQTSRSARVLQDPPFAERNQSSEHGKADVDVDRRTGKLDPRVLPDTLKFPHAIDRHSDPQRGALHSALVRPAHGRVGAAPASLRNSVRGRRLDRPQLRAASESGGDGWAFEGDPAAPEFRTERGSFGGLS